MIEPTEADIQSALSGIEPGWYPVSDLLPRYNEWASRESRPNADPRGLGQALWRHFSDAPRRKIRGNTTSRYLDQNILHHRAWFREV